MNIEIIGKFFDNHSLSKVNRYTALLLSKKHKVRILPLDEFRHENKLSNNIVKELIELTKTELDNVDIQLRHTYPPIWTYPASDSTKVVYMQPWEYTKIPSEWQYKFDTFADALVTPSTWVTNVYLQAGLNPRRVCTVPLGVDGEIYNKENRKSDDDLFTFTFVGNAQYRKGIDILLKAWSGVFKKSHKVRLIIKDNPSIYGQTKLLDDIIKLQYHTECGKIEYIDKNLSEEEMSDIFKKTDILVHPYRGEGFGMHIQEAMACGAVPLVSRVGGAEDFVTEENSFLIDGQVVGVDLSNPNVFAIKSGDSLSPMQHHGSIFEPNAEHLAKQMWTIYDNVERHKVLKTKNNNSNIKSWNQVTEILENNLITVKEFNNVKREVFS